MSSDAEYQLNSCVSVLKTQPNTGARTRRRKEDSKRAEIQFQRDKFGIRTIMIFKDSIIKKIIQQVIKLPYKEN